MWDLLKDIYGYMIERKKFWLTPVMIVILLLSILVVYGESSAAASFIYAIF